jgi:cysteine desulfurase/selenocysteine lyase
MDWRSEWFEFDDVTYLNLAGQAPMPRVSIRAAQEALEWKKNPSRLPDSIYFDLPNRIRGLIAPLIGGRPDEIALTTGATGGLAAVAAGFDWKPEDEILIARGEFPAHLATWMPLMQAGRLQVKIIAPRERFITAADFLAHISKRTRLVSVSLVRFDDGARLDTPELARACREAGALLLLDISQCAGAMPMDVRALGADFAVCSGYKWLLGPFGTGFFWARAERIAEMRPAPFYWMALEGAHEFHKLWQGNSWTPAAGARRWDSPETASFFNLAPMAASLEFVLRAGLENIWQHNRRLMAEMAERLPLDRCVLASPADPDARGPYACVAARSPEKTAALYEELREAKVIVSLREGALRVSPHLFNTERDIDRLLAVLAV